MSTRPSTRGSTPATSTLSPPMFASPTTTFSSLPHATPALSSVPGPSSRHTRYDSSASLLPVPPPRAGYSRRVSAVSDATRRSGSGVSTPRRAMRDGAPPADLASTDWAGMDADDVFRRLPVHEVKKVEARLRADALNKQSELRSMVGERYRDLLTSASQITALHSSSLHLSGSLRAIAQACADPAGTASSAASSTGPPDGAGADSEGGGDDTQRRLPAAAHMKLLLDAPEVLYAFMAHHAYLSAAFLWLVARVVKEGLAGMPDDLKAPYTPLLQKQWDTLLPFRSQISQRATAALKSRDQLDTKTLSETLLAIILLDNLALDDALDLFLAQRLKALRDVLAHAAAPSSQASHEPQARRRRDSRVLAAAAVREAMHSRDAIAKALAEAAQSMLATAELVSAVFGARRRLDGDASLLVDMIRAVQEGEAAPQQAAPPPPRRQSSHSHQHRTSRLASISLPLPRMNSHGRGPPVSAGQIIESLPSSQILLRYLPSSITAFTPFIGSSPSPDVAGKVAAWHKSAIAVLTEAAPAWLRDLQSVADVWHVRSTLKAVLADNDFGGEIANALEAEWGGRVTRLWESKLASLLEAAESAVRDAAERARAAPAADELDPESWAFGDVAFPTGQAQGAAHATPFASFVAQLKKRGARRSPLLDGALAVVEDAAADLGADMRDLPSGLHGVYAAKVAAALVELVALLGRLLDAVGAGPDAGHCVEAELFVGRVALYLATSSGFLVDLVGAADVELADTRAALVDVHRRSTARWSRRAVDDALALLAPIFDPLVGEQEITLAWQGPAPASPSHALVVALSSLVQAVRQLGMPPGAKLSPGPDLLAAFAERVGDMAEWKAATGAAAAQGAVDLGFLVALRGDAVDKDPAVQKMLAKAPADLSGFAQALPGIVDDYLRRTQLLLAPLLALPPIEDGAGARAAGARRGERNAALLRLGQPAGARPGAAAEFKSPLAVARIGKRFGLLSVVA